MTSLLCKINFILVALFHMFCIWKDLDGPTNLWYVTTMYILTILVNDILLAGAFLDMKTLVFAWITFYSGLLGAASVSLTFAKRIPAWNPVASKSFGRAAVKALNLDPHHQQAIAVVFSLILYLVVLLNWILPDKSEEEVLPQYVVSSSSQGDSSNPRLTLK